MFHKIHQRNLQSSHKVSSPHSHQYDLHSIMSIQCNFRVYMTPRSVVNSLYPAASVTFDLRGWCHVISPSNAILPAHGMQVDEMKGQIISSLCLFCVYEYLDNQCTPFYVAFLGRN